jgi:hypothetical protein
MYNIVNKIITENFPNLEKTMPIQVQEASRTLNRPDQNKTTPWHIIIKTTSTETRERILKAVREKTQIMYEGKPIKITADFSTETLKARRAWSEIFQALNENNFRIFQFSCIFQDLLCSQKCDFFWRKLLRLLRRMCIL